MAGKPCIALALVSRHMSIASIAIKLAVMSNLAWMNMSYYEYAFEAPIERLAIGNTGKVLYYNVVILPDWCIDELPFGEFPKLRVIGEIADHPIRGAWNPIADGRKYFILSAKFLGAAGLAVGDTAEVRFNIDDQEFVELPPELETLLASDRKVSDAWNGLTPGKKRFYCHQIASAKHQSTRDRRLQTVLTQLMV